MFVFTLFFAKIGCGPLALAEHDDQGNWYLRFIATPPDVSFMVYQLERCPATQNIHLQGCCEFAAPTCISDLKRRNDQFGNNGIRWAVARCGRQAQIDYCTKLDSRLNIDEDPILFRDESRVEAADAAIATMTNTAQDQNRREAVTHGPVPRSNRRRPRTDDEQEDKKQKAADERLACDKLKAKLLAFLMANFRKTYSMWSACNACLRDITDPAKGKVITATMTKLIQNGSQIQRMVDERVEALARQMYGSNTRKMDVRVYWGRAGSKKSSTALDDYGKYTRVTHHISSAGKFMCNYDGHQVLILDEFGGETQNQNRSPQMILAWTAGDQCDVERKGKAVWRS